MRRSWLERFHLLSLYLPVVQDLVTDRVHSRLVFPITSLLIPAYFWIRATGLPEDDTCTVNHSFVFYMVTVTWPVGVVGILLANVKEQIDRAIFRIWFGTLLLMAVTGLNIWLAYRLIPAFYCIISIKTRVEVLFAVGSSTLFFSICSLFLLISSIRVSLNLEFRRLLFYNRYEEQCFKYGQILIHGKFGRKPRKTIWVAPRTYTVEPIGCNEPDVSISNNNNVSNRVYKEYVKQQTNEVISNIDDDHDDFNNNNIDKSNNNCCNCCNCCSCCRKLNLFIFKYIFSEYIFKLVYQSIFFFFLDLKEPLGFRYPQKILAGVLGGLYTAIVLVILAISVIYIGNPSIRSFIKEYSLLLGPVINKVNKIDNFEIFVDEIIDSVILSLYVGSVFSFLMIFLLILSVLPRYKRIILYMRTGTYRDNYWACKLNYSGLIYMYKKLLGSDVIVSYYRDTKGRLDLRLLYNNNNNNKIRNNSNINISTLIKKDDLSIEVGLRGTWDNTERNALHMLEKSTDKRLWRTNENNKKYHDTSSDDIKSEAVVGVRLYKSILDPNPDLFKLFNSATFVACCFFVVFFT
eukprot:GHVR01029080.1.p1 GENE.GHVR01029080.1~~GHVR01029080.1.p1  ORF type:complete len:575 (+),score=121.91 GHVR01029080.1:31-1755(+)